MKKTNWTTYKTTCYTFDAANDQRSAGGLHHHQVRLTPGGWQYRIRQCNGKFRAHGPVQSITAADGEARFASAL